MSAIKLHKNLEAAKTALAIAIRAKKGGVPAARRALLAAETAAAPLGTLDRRRFAEHAENAEAEKRQRSKIESIASGLMPKGWRFSYSGFSARNGNTIIDRTYSGSDAEFLRVRDAIRSICR